MNRNDWSSKTRKGAIDRDGDQKSCFLPRRMEAVLMAKSKTNRKRTPKHVLKLPDLEQSKSAVLNSLTSQSSQRTYDHAIREFIEWYCSEPRLAFNKTVVTRYRISLEQRHYASTTINLRLAAVRRLAYEAADCGLLSADLAAGIRRVKGVSPQHLQQHVGQRRKVQPQLIAPQVVRAGAITKQHQLFLDAILHVSSRAVLFFVQRLCGPCFATQRGHHEARILSLLQILGLGHYPSCATQTLSRLIDELCEP